MVVVSGDNKTDSWTLPRPGLDNSNKVIASALKRKQRRSKRNNGYRTYGNYEEEEYTIVSSPLLESTPSIVTKSLVKLYPYLLLIDYLLGILTWDNDDYWVNYILIVVYALGVKYFQICLKYLGHLFVFLLIWCYSRMDRYVDVKLDQFPSLDDIVHLMLKLSVKCDRIMAPITFFITQDIRHIFFTFAFLSPIYVLITTNLLSSIFILEALGIYVFTYHSRWSKIVRAFIWKMKVIQIIFLYIIGPDGLDIERAKNSSFSKVTSKLGSSSMDKLVKELENGKTVIFTFVLYENQRRWLGIGWTSSMLTYERSAWTDEFLNTAPSPDEFELPEGIGSVSWEWDDETWKVDLTNDGVIPLPHVAQNTTDTPDENEGFLYTDNMWSRPSKDDSFSKYTRRRRWIRKAKLIKNPSDPVRLTQQKNGLGNRKTIETCGNKSYTVINDNISRSDRYGTDSNVQTKLSRSRKVSFSDVTNVRYIPARDDE